MMGQQKSERELFSYAVNLEKRVRSDHPLRRVAAAIDFSLCVFSFGNAEEMERPGLRARDRSRPRCYSRL